MNNKIARIRKEKGYSQKEFAEMCGISHWWLNHIERGKRTPSLTLILKISEVLKVSPNEIFFNK